MQQTATQQTKFQPPDTKFDKDGELRPALNFASILDLLKQTWTEWNEDKAPRLGAAFAYYTIFSLAPLLIVAITIAGFVFGDKAASGQIQKEISGMIGPDAATMIQNMIDSASKSKNTGIFASVASIATLLLGSSALFGQLQESLNTIWEVAPKPSGGIMQMLIQRLLSFSMVLGVGFVLLVSLVLSAGITAAGHFMGDYLPMPEGTLQLLNFVVSFFIVTLLFALIFKVLPDAEVKWHDVWIGAAITSLLFALGRYGLSIYLGRAGVSSAYGAAGSLVLILLWVYYAAQILFFGAEFAQVYANRYGSRVRPSENAVPMTDDMRAKQGLPRLSDLQSTEIAQDAVQSGKKVGRVSILHNQTPQEATLSQKGQAKKAKQSANKASDLDYLLGLFGGLLAVLAWVETRDSKRRKKLKVATEVEETEPDSKL